MPKNLVPLLNDLGQTIIKYPNVPWQDVLSKGQLYSKTWLIETVVDLDLDLDLTFIVGGWIGSLAALMFAEPKLRVHKIRSFDIDPNCAEIAESLNQKYLERWQFKASTANMFDLNYSTCVYPTKKEDGSIQHMVEYPDSIINTSCDHIENFSDWWDKIPDNKLVIVQNNDFKDGDDSHVNTVRNLKEFEIQTPMTEVFYSGKLELMKYTRFMRIGLR